MNDRPSDSTTKILKAWIAFIDVLYQEGATCELSINNVEIARAFALDADTFRKLLNPQGNRHLISFASGDRLTFASSVKALPERLLLARETHLINNGRHHSVFDTVPSSEPLWSIPSTSYITDATEKQFSHGYNTAHDNRMRGETVDET